MKVSLKLLLSGLMMLISGIANANIYTVTCQNSQATDRANIQSAINNAAESDTIYIAGLCQLDGKTIFINKSNLMITGAGQAGGWSSVIKGIADINGHPVSDFDYLISQGIEFNHGFEIGDGSSNAQIKGVVIKNLKFTTLNHAVQVRPELNAAGLCSQIVVGTGYSSNVTIDNNWFDNNYRSVEATGRNDKLLVTSNRITNVANDSSGNVIDIDGTGDAINLQGHCRTCINDISHKYVDIPVLLGSIKNSTVSNNYIDLGPSGGRWIRLIGMEESLITNNMMTSDPNTTTVMYVSSNKNLQVTNNIIQGSGSTDSFGYAAQDLFPSLIPNYPSSSSNIIVKNNSISNAFIGIAVDSDTTDHQFINNKISGSLFKDIYLCGDPMSDPICLVNNEVGPSASFNNHVVTSAGSVVINNGTDNHVTLTGK